MAHTDYMHSFGAKYLKYKQRVIKILEVERFHHRYILKEGEWMTAIFFNERPCNDCHFATINGGRVGVACGHFLECLQQRLELKIRVCLAQLHASPDPKNQLRFKFFQPNTASSSNSIMDLLKKCGAGPNSKVFVECLSVLHQLQLLWSREKLLTIIIVKWKKCFFYFFS
jgi:hypothetical protein